MSDIDDSERSRKRARLERPGRDRSMDRDRERGSGKSSNNRVYVLNIPYEYRWQEMKDLFRSKVGDVQFVELFVDDNHKPKGCGIVEFSDSSSVKKCLEVMQKYEVMGRKLVVREDSGNVRDKHGAIIGSGGGKRARDSDGPRYRDDRDMHRGGGSMSMRQDDVKWGNTYGLSPGFLESLNIVPPLSSKVFVANLEYNIDKKKLKNVFRVAGRVIGVEVPLDKDGRSRGFAVVEYDHPVEAVQAISMLHNQFLFDRPMTVRMDRANEGFKLPEGLRTVGMGLGRNGDPLKCVAHNLPSLGSNTQQSGGAGILGSVQNNPWQIANALSGLGNVGSLQAANLSGLASNLLGNGLGGADLSSLVASAQNPLQNQATQQQLAALAAQNSGSASMQPFGRGDGDIPYSSQSRGFGQSYNEDNPSYNDRGFQSNVSDGYGGSGGGYGNDRMSSLRSSDRDGGNKSNTRKVLVSNLPSSASYKMLYEKFTEYGDVLSFEEKRPGSVLLTYGSEWQSERAIKNLDRARIDGQMIDARLYF